MVRIGKDIVSVNLHFSVSSSDGHFWVGGAVLFCPFHVSYRTVLSEESLIFFGPIT